MDLDDEEEEARSSSLPKVTNPLAIQNNSGLFLT